MRTAYQHPQLVAFTGQISHGKSAAADYLINHHGFERVSFADPLKEMLMTLGLSREQLYDQRKKEEPCGVVLGGKTPRHAMQTLGTEWGRKMIHTDIWAEAALRKMTKAIDEDRRLVIDDLRFDNEAKVVRSLGGIVVQIIRPDLDDARSFWSKLLRHSSERGVSHNLIDVYLHNDSTLDMLHESLESMLEGPSYRPFIA